MAVRDLAERQKPPRQHGRGKLGHKNATRIHLLPFIAPSIEIIAGLVRKHGIQRAARVNDFETAGMGI